jgi:hypothetical protein
MSTDSLIVDSTEHRGSLDDSKPCQSPPLDILKASSHVVHLNSQPGGCFFQRATDKSVLGINNREEAFNNKIESKKKITTL